GQGDGEVHGRGSGVPLGLGLVGDGQRRVVVLDSAGARSGPDDGVGRSRQVDGEGLVRLRGRVSAGVDGHRPRGRAGGKAQGARGGDVVHAGRARRAGRGRPSGGGVVNGDGGGRGRRQGDGEGVHGGAGVALGVADVVDRQRVVI